MESVHVNIITQTECLAETDTVYSEITIAYSSKQAARLSIALPANSFEDDDNYEFA